MRSIHQNVGVTYMYMCNSPKVNGSVQSTFLAWTSPIEILDCSIWPFWPIFDPCSTWLLSIFHVQHRGKHLTLQLLWIANSESIGFTYTSIHVYVEFDRSVVYCSYFTSQKYVLAVYSSWRRFISQELFVIQEWCLNLYSKIISGNGLLKIIHYTG